MSGGERVPDLDADHHPSVSASASDIAALVLRLADAERALRAAIQGSVDSAILPAGHSYLLADAQQALIASESRSKEQAALLSAIFENAPDDVTYVGLDGRVKYANRVAPDLSYEQVIDTDWLSLQDDASREALRGTFDSVVATGLPASFEGPRTARDGTVRHYSRRLGAVRQDGQVVGVVLITRDVTDRYRMEEDAREARALAENILSTVREPLVVLDGALSLVSANSAFTETFQISKGETYGKPLYELSNRQWDTPQLRSVLTSVLPQRLEVTDYEIEQDLPSLGKRTMLLNARRIQRSEEDQALMLLAFQDVTDRDEHIRIMERQRQLEAANQELDAFAHSVSHDLRAPLRAIDGFSRALVDDQESSLSPDGADFVARIRKNATRMTQLIDDLLRFSRVGRVVPNLEVVDMNAIVKAVLEDSLEKTFGREIKLEVDDLPTAEGDKNLLRQVWENLLGNAIKYSRDRDVARIRVAGETQAHEHVYSVSDNGAGFDMTYADKLFGVFQRLHSEAQFEGTGVGLSLVRRIITRHGGRVWANAKSGEGATFWFTLPVRRPLLR